MGHSRDEVILEIQREKVKNIAIGSLDKEALYSSIDQVEGPKIIVKDIRKSGLK